MLRGLTFSNAGTQPPLSNDPFRAERAAVLEKPNDQISGAIGQRTDAHLIACKGVARRSSRTR